VVAALLECAIGVLPGSAAASEGAAQPVLGLAVQPGGLLIQGIAPGETYDLKERAGIGLIIFNRDSREHTYLLSTHRPSEIGNRRLPPGYSDLPDASWFWFERSEVSVPGQSSTEVRMYLKIPDDERYHNQHWSVSVGVVGKAVPGDMLTLAAYPRYEIETAAAARSELALRPAGGIGLCPSAVALSGLISGSERKSEFILCNNDGCSHRYRLSVLREGQVRENQRVFVSGGHEWLPDPTWLKTRYEKLKIARRRFVSIPFKVRVPADAIIPDGAWEGIIFVTRDDGATAFVRVLIEGKAAVSEGGED